MSYLIVLCFIVLTLSGLNAKSNLICIDLFNSNSMTASKLNISLSDKLKGIELIDAVQLKKHKDKINFSEKMLAKNHVEYELASSNKWLGLKEYKILKISTTGSHYLNRIAKKMFENFGTTLIWDPTELGQLSGAFIPKKNIILISKTTAYTGEADITLFHEIKHAAMTYKELNKKTSIINGATFKLPLLSWPWKQHSASEYKNYFSIQELTTYRQGLIYSLLSYKNFINNSNITKNDLINYLNSIEIKSKNIIYDIKMNIQFELTAFKNNQGHVKYDTKKESINILSVNFPSISAHEIPRSYFNEKLAEQDKILNSRQLQFYFNGIFGEARAKKIAIAYLNDLLLIATAQEQEVLHIEKTIELTKNKIQHISLNSEGQKDLTENYKELLIEFLNTIQ